MSFKTLLEDAGEKIAADFKKAEPILVDATQDAQKAEPIVALSFPAIAPLFDTTVSMVLSAEALGTSAAASADTGTQKLSAVVAALEPIAVAYLKGQGVTAPTTAQITTWVNAIVSALNAFTVGSSTPASS